MNSMHVRFSFLPPELKLRWISSLLILLITASISVFMTFVPLTRPEPLSPQWLWLLCGCVMIAYLCGIWTIPTRAVQAAAARDAELTGDRTALLSAVAISDELGPEGLILRSKKKPEKGWISIGGDVLAVRSATGTVREITPHEIASVTRVDVLNRHFFEPQIAISLKDGFVVQAIPTRPGMGSILPYGSRRFDALLLDLDRFRSSIT